LEAGRVRPATGWPHFEEARRGSLEDQEGDLILEETRDPELQELIKQVESVTKGDLT
jgi:hypothetical protein